jgi:glucosamine 6-phosphate synthetase-like amidotransferase/phosphosugar isomerase protein
MNALQQVTAREGRPIIICEKGDKETQGFASKSLEVPHTVDCLQVSHKNTHLEYFILYYRRNPNKMITYM